MAETGPRLIVGLGNPGPRYEATRHNAGFWLVDRLAAREGQSWRAERRGRGESCRIELDGHPVWLFKPATFMNLSGQAIAPFAAFYRIPRTEILLVHDDLDLPPGTVRLKRDGGHGGHNGLRDSIRHLGGNDFLRLRLGIGHPGISDAVVGYVLERAPAVEREQIQTAIDAALQVMPDIVAGRLDRAMQALHTRKPAA